MGYTHYFMTPSWTQKTRAGFKKAAELLQPVLLQDGNIQFKFDDNSPPMVSAEIIQFNGRGSDGHEDFAIGPRCGFGWSFCKTNRKPYDDAVCYCLLVIKACCPDVQLGSDGWASDGSCDSDSRWPQAYNDAKSDFPGLDFSFFKSQLPQAVVPRRLYKVWMEVEEWDAATDEYRDITKAGTVEPRTLGVFSSLKHAVDAMNNCEHSAGDVALENWGGNGAA